ncbi:MAG: ATP-binding protein [Patescibacteria group bacterium]|jgi:predicted AAA+ superfamily ATPase|nr:ATP-binding protein [Patescibacteria group bacterium]
MIQRIYNNLDNYFKANQALIIYGPRRVGKTTLLNSYLKNTKFKYKLDNGDDIKLQNTLKSQDFKKILAYAEGYELIAIDEAQQIPNIGMALKILVDNSKGIRIIATGSSSFDLSQQIGEPLTGRKITMSLYALSQKELLSKFNKHELKENLEDFLVFGSYPDIALAKNNEEKIELLEELVSSYLLKDILILDKVKSSALLLNLLKLLSFQVGNLVSLNELANTLKIDAKTIDRYLDLLEKSFIIFRLGGFSRNLRNEINSKAKYYFLDNGIRNAVISQYSNLSNRNDVGQLFENFIFSERLKKCTYDKIYGSRYFWRNYNGKEIDLIEERDGKLFAYEIKWSKDYVVAPSIFTETYQNSEYQIINKNNYLDFIL